jgi:hypothetical protein
MPSEVTKVEDLIKDSTDQTFTFVDEFLEEAMRIEVFMKQMKMLIVNIGHQTIMLMHHLLNLSISNILDNKHVNIIHLP